MKSIRENSKTVFVVLDIFERVALAGLFSYFAWTMGHDWLETGSISSFLLIVSESAVLFFVLIRRFTNEVSARPSDWLVALLGTATPLVVQPTGTSAIVPAAACALLMLLGILVQVAAKLTLRRSFGAVAANRGVKVSGPYRFVRHPMYAGYFLTQIGFLLAHPTLWNAVVYSAAFAFQIWRILAEERVLNHDASYRQFAILVPYRLVPRVY